MIPSQNSYLLGQVISKRYALNLEGSDWRDLILKKKSPEEGF